MESDATGGEQQRPRSRAAQVWHFLVGFSPAIVVGATLAYRDVGTDSLAVRIAAAFFLGMAFQVAGSIAIEGATQLIKRALGLPLTADYNLEPFAPGLVGSLLVAACLWAWASTEDKYLPGELAYCFRFELEPGSSPSEADIRWCMESTQDARRNSQQDSEW